MHEMANYFASHQRHHELISTATLFLATISRLLIDFSLCCLALLLLTTWRSTTMMDAEMVVRCEFFRRSKKKLNVQLLFKLLH